MKKWSDIYSKEQINQYLKFKKIAEYAKAGASPYYSSDQIMRKVLTISGVAFIISMIIIITLIITGVLGIISFKDFDPTIFGLIFLIFSAFYYVLIPNIISMICSENAKSGTEKALRLLKSYPLYTPESKAAYQQLQADIVNLSDEEAVSAWVTAESSNMEYMKANEKLKVLYQSEKKDILDRKLQ